MTAHQDTELHFSQPSAHSTCIVKSFSLASELCRARACGIAVLASSFLTASPQHLFLCSIVKRHCLNISVHCCPSYCLLTPLMSLSPKDRQCDWSIDRLVQPPEFIWTMIKPRYTHKTWALCEHLIYRVCKTLHKLVYTLLYMSAVMPTTLQEGAWWQDLAADNFWLYDQQCPSTTTLQTNLNKHKLHGYLLLPLSRLRPSKSTIAM